MLRTTGDRAKRLSTLLSFAFAHTFGSFDAVPQTLSIAFCRLLTIQGMLL
jgi:hypothetical protein